MTSAHPAARRRFHLGCHLAAAIAVASSGLAQAQAPAQPAATAKPTAKAPAKPADASARSAQRAAALAAFTVQQLNASQLDVADRVLTGVADCEFNQKVAIDPVHGHPGHFHVRHGKGQYTMVPQETSTGAVRLEDKRTGMVWLQIPAKSMLMNAKIGQRVADSCTLAEQRAAVTAVQQAIGIAAPAPGAASAATAPEPAASR